MRFIQVRRACVRASYTSHIDSLCLFDQFACRQPGSCTFSCGPVRLPRWLRGTGLPRPCRGENSFGRSRRRRVTMVRSVDARKCDESTTAPGLDGANPGASPSSDPKPFPEHAAAVRPMFAAGATRGARHGERLRSRESGRPGKLAVLGGGVGALVARPPRPPDRSRAIRTVELMVPLSVGAAVAPAHLNAYFERRNPRRRPPAARRK
jgi:hypothetical protein